MFLTLALALHAVKPDARVVLPQVADALPCFVAGEFSYNRHWLRELPPDMQENYERQIARGTDPRFDPATLLTLLADPRPKVRTLAAAALYSRDEPVHLPRVVALANDQAESFQSVREELGAVWDQKAKPVFLRQTVGDCVRRMVNAYLPVTLREEVRDGEPIQRPYPIDRFTAYWMPRKDRTHCVGWFRVALMRASGRIEPIQPDRVAGIRRVRQRIDALPELDRGLTLLALAQETGGEVLVSDAELVAACKSLGRGRLLSLLRRQPVSDDPDLQPDPKGASEYGRMPRRFVLLHAAELLKPEDADTLVAFGEAERADQTLTSPYRSPDWAIAAADLRPDRAKEFLTAAWNEFQTRYDSYARPYLAIARRRHGIDDGNGFIVNWFYTDPPPRSSYGGGTDHFLAELRDTPADRRLVVAIVRDGRFATMEGLSLGLLCRLVNSWERPPVVAAVDERYQDLSGTRLYRAGAPSAKLAAELDRWRAALRTWADKQ